MKTPDYWREAGETLARRDSILRPIIARYADEPGLASRGEAYQTLLQSIVNQQISVKAGASIWRRIHLQIGEPTPKRIIAAGLSPLRECGLSEKKGEYAIALAERFLRGEFNSAQLAQMDDGKAAESLMRARGIGLWTAQMFLMFHLLRPDILPLDDVGLRRAMSKCYHDGEPLSREEMEMAAERWRPWRTVAVWHLWRSLDPLPIAY